MMAFLFVRLGRVREVVSTGEFASNGEPPDG
jgi:hypothetical protein